MVDKSELFIIEFENWVWVVEKFEFGYENLWFDSGLGFDWNLSLFVENFWAGFILIEGKFYAFSCTQLNTVKCKYFQ